MFMSCERTTCASAFRNVWMCKKCTLYKGERRYYKRFFLQICMFCLWWKLYEWEVFFLCPAASKAVTFIQLTDVNGHTAAIRQRLNLDFINMSPVCMVTRAWSRGHQGPWRHRFDALLPSWPWGCAATLRGASAWPFLPPLPLCDLEEEGGGRTVREGVEGGQWGKRQGVGTQVTNFKPFFLYMILLIVGVGPS